MSAGECNCNLARALAQDVFSMAWCKWVTTTYTSVTILWFWKYNKRHFFILSIISEVTVLSVSRFCKMRRQGHQEHMVANCSTNLRDISQNVNMLLYRNHRKYNGEVSYLCLLMPKQSTSFTAFSVSTNAICLLYACNKCVYWLKYFFVVLQQFSL